MSPLLFCLFFISHKHLYSHCFLMFDAFAAFKHLLYPTQSALFYLHSQDPLLLDTVVTLGVILQLASLYYKARRPLKASLMSDQLLSGVCHRSQFFKFNLGFTLFLTGCHGVWCLLVVLSDNTSRMHSNHKGYLRNKEISPRTLAAFAIETCLHRCIIYL